MARHGAESHRVWASRPRGGSDGCSQHFGFFPNGVGGGRPRRSTQHRRLLAKRDALHTPAVAVQCGCGCPARPRRARQSAGRVDLLAPALSLCRERSYENSRDRSSQRPPACGARATSSYVTPRTSVVTCSAQQKSGARCEQRFCAWIPRADRSVGAGRRGAATGKATGEAAPQPPGCVPRPGARSTVL